MTDRKLSAAGGQKYDRKVTNVNENKIFFNRTHTALQPIADLFYNTYTTIYAQFYKGFGQCRGRPEEIKKPFYTDRILAHLRNHV